ncbi:MAG TPA: PadR family transcriptional regulator [Xanthomonadaceae bacterium]|nr:PadR family transcriptional regulator [Xanthomonadaceae bacterium]
MTELDFTILAIIGREGPLSAYDVRKVFAQSLTPTWSSSTGSVYPSIGRLEIAGLVTASTPKGVRSRKALRITTAGRAALERWLTTITPEIAAATPDPIRTRMFFLMCVGPQRRPEMIKSAIESTEAAIQEAERRRLARPHRDGVDPRHLASEGVMFELRARLEWLRWLLGEFLVPEIMR